MGRDRELATTGDPLFESIGADGEPLITELMFCKSDEGGGASIPDSMARTGERLVNRSREGSGTSLSAAITPELAEFQVGK